jgi:hypothetical protein
MVVGGVTFGVSGSFSSEEHEKAKRADMAMITAGRNFLLLILSVSYILSPLEEIGFRKGYHPLPE